MSSGIVHDKAITLSAPVVAVAIAAFTTTALGLTVGVSYFVGGFWLSPDLDVPSRPFHRWGILKCLWLPYQKAIPHRSPISHGIIVGTLGRVGYLFMFCLPFLILGIIPLPKIDFIYIAAIWVGLEMSAWCHLLLDK